MPSLNFKGQFASAVQDGRKTQTIRATRKVPIKVGDTLYLYTGMRTKSCKRLRVVNCTAVRRIQITNDKRTRWLTVKVDGRILPALETYTLAVRDGFQDGLDLAKFFEETHGSKFSGHLIEWRAV